MTKIKGQPQDHIYPIGCGHSASVKCRACTPRVEDAPQGLTNQVFYVHDGSGPSLPQAREAVDALREVFGVVITKKYKPRAKRKGGR